MARGSSAVMTAAWLASTLRSAQASKSGKPRALPSSDSPSQRACPACGQGAREASNQTKESRPAMTQRPQVTNQGESSGAWVSPVARRVMGRVMAKMNTPSKPSQVPARVLAAVLT